MCIRDRSMAAAVLGAALGAFVERVLVAKLYDKPLDQFLITLGVGLLLTELVQIIWGPDFKAAPQLKSLNGTVSVLGGSVTIYRLILIGVGVTVFGAMLWVL